MRLPLTAALSLAALAWSIHAQAPETFEAASIRPSAPTTTFRSTTDRSQFIARAHTLVMLVATSHPDLPIWRISGGPSWAEKDGWDVVAKLPTRMPGDQQQLYRRTEQMLQAFLAEQFNLKTHLERRQQPVYELVIAKGGPNLKPSVASQFSYRDTPTGIELQHIVMAEFATLLYSPSSPRELADRFVVDKTGLTGYYDFSLNWAPSNVQSESTSLQPSIFTALQAQLGLKLMPSRGPVDFLVIDHADRPQPN